MNCIPTKHVVMGLMYGVVMVISAWALALSVQQYRAMRRPQRVGQTTGSSHASFLSRCSCWYRLLMVERERDFQYSIVFTLKISNDENIGF